MSRAFDTSRLARMVLLGAAGLAAAGFSPVTIAPSMARSITSYETEVQDPYGGGSEPEFIPFPQIPGDDGMLLGQPQACENRQKKGDHYRQEQDQEGRLDGEGQDDFEEGRLTRGNCGFRRISPRFWLRTARVVTAARGLA